MTFGAVASSAVRAGADHVTVPAVRGAASPASASSANAARSASGNSRAAAALET